jgi:ATP-binding cassette, subfamily B, bacterial
MPTDPYRTHAKIKTKDVVQHFLPLLRPFRLQLCWAVVAMVLDALLTVLRPWPLKVVIDRVLAHKSLHLPLLAGWLEHASFSRLAILYGACVTTLLISLSTGLLTYSYTRVLGDVGQHFVFLLRGNLFAHMQRLSLRFHDRQRIGDLITRLTSDMQAIQDVIASASILLVSNVCLLAGMLILMFWLNWQFALAALAGAPMLLWTSFRYKGRIKSATRAARVSDGLLGSVAQETLTSIRIVQGLAQEQQQQERFQAQNRDSLHARLESVRYQAALAPFVDVLAAVGLVVVMWYGATRVLEGVLTTGDVVIFFAYVTSLYSPLRALARLSYTLNRASVGAERIAEVLRTQREISDRKDARSVSRLRGSIEFRDVSFCYEMGQPVLSHIHLKIAAGEKVAIVGATGEGKSTLLSLIPRLYDPSDGAVYIDGEDIRTYTVQSLREQISLVLQDSLLFRGTIRDNIAFGRSSASDEEIIAAARTANADEFIQQLPDGYETLVSERGTTLSGGQKQRIAIARAILRDTPILILDEPTTGLDGATKRKVVEALERAAAGRSTIIITHDLAPMRFTDRIIVLEEGQIIEEGTHTELLARNGRYVHLLQLADRADESRETSANITAEAPHSVGMQHGMRI